MAKEMAFTIGEKEYSAQPVKIDRKKLYGWSEIHAFDDDGNDCLMVSTDTSGTFIIPKGGIALGLVSSNGKWVQRSNLKTVKLDGSDAVLTTSSYNAVNVLDNKATDEDLLDCSITACYHMKTSDDLIAAVGNNIYKFEYCYRDSFETSPAFLLTAEIEEKKELFLMIGTQNIFDFIGLNEVSIAEDSEIEDEEDSDEIDFGML
ncbi:MAG: hypothetical protein LBU83_11210 [Bacteroidales bacterium]|jgi:hypothetical protein|nr:hypothetical protein [Bacteroidales bacterium]